LLNSFTVQSRCNPECQAVNPLWWPSLTKDMQTEQLLCWSGMTDMEHHSTTSSFNEEEEDLVTMFQVVRFFCQG